VLRFVARDSHDPIRAATWRAAADLPPRAATSAAWIPAAAGEPPLRPLQTFDPPQPIDTLAQTPDGPPLRFRWRRQVHDIAASEGPERIAPEWWRAPAGEAGPPRDYYRIEDRQGRRFWVFREGLHGGAAAVKWFVHGVFA